MSSRERVRIAWFCAAAKYNARLERLATMTPHSRTGMLLVGLPATIRKSKMCDGHKTVWHFLKVTGRVKATNPSSWDM